ncbi:MAG: SfiI family type II restriction endonuclease [Planctomycetota bacterium]
MNPLRTIAELSDDEIEAIKRSTLRWAFLAAADFAEEAAEIFRDSPDEVKDIAEDITRDMFDRLPMGNLPQRVLGTVDYKKAWYLLLPEHAVRQAFFADSKAERSETSMTIQMSQTSLRVIQHRAGEMIDEAGHLPVELEVGDYRFLTSNLFTHFRYREERGVRRLHTIRVCSLPNGRLQDRYNPSADRTIFIAGRNAPSLEELFRARVSFSRLKALANWRVQRIDLDPEGQAETIQWEE